MNMSFHFGGMSWWSSGLVVDVPVFQVSRFHAKKIGAFRDSPSPPSIDPQRSLRSERWAGRGVCASKAEQSSSLRQRGLRQSEVVWYVNGTWCVCALSLNVWAPSTTTHTVGKPTLGLPRSNPFISAAQ